MSRFPRWWLPLLALLVAPVVAAANDADARAALALAVATQRPAALTVDYARLRARAIAENRPLLIWVGFRRTDLELARPDCLHYQCAAFPGAVSPCVVVSRPNGGELWRDADLPATAVDALRSTVTPARVCGPGGCR